MGYTLYLRNRKHFIELNARGILEKRNYGFVKLRYIRLCSRLILAVKPRLILPRINGPTSNLYCGNLTGCSTPYLHHRSPIYGEYQSVPKPVNFW